MDGKSMEASYSSGDDNDDVVVSRPASKSPPLEPAQPVPLIPVTMPSFPSPSSKKKEIQKKKKMSPSCDEIAVREEKSKFFNSLRVGDVVAIASNGKLGHHDVCNKRPYLHRCAATVTETPVYPSTWLKLAPIYAKALGIDRGSFPLTIKLRTSQIRKIPKGQTATTAVPWPFVRVNKTVTVPTRLVTSTAAAAAAAVSAAFREVRAADRGLLPEHSKAGTLTHFTMVGATTATDATSDTRACTRESCADMLRAYPAEVAQKSTATTAATPTSNHRTERDAAAMGGAASAPVGVGDGAASYTSSCWQPQHTAMVAAAGGSAAFATVRAAVTVASSTVGAEVTATASNNAAAAAQAQASATPGSSSSDVRDGPGDGASAGVTANNSAGRTRGAPSVLGAGAGAGAGAIASQAERSKKRGEAAAELGPLNARPGRTNGDVSDGDTGHASAARIAAATAAAASRKRHNSGQQKGQQQQHKQGRVNTNRPTAASVAPLPGRSSLLPSAVAACFSSVIGTGTGNTGVSSSAQKKTTTALPNKQTNKPPTARMPQASAAGGATATAARDAPTHEEKLAAQVQVQKMLQLKKLKQEQKLKLKHKKQKQKLREKEQEKLQALEHNRMQYAAAARVHAQQLQWMQQAQAAQQFNPQLVAQLASAGQMYAGGLGGPRAPAAAATAAQEQHAHAAMKVAAQQNPALYRAYMSLSAQQQQQQQQAAASPPTNTAAAWLNLQGLNNANLVSQAAAAAQAAMAATGLTPSHGGYPTAGMHTSPLQANDTGLYAAAVAQTQQFGVTGVGAAAQLKAAQMYMNSDPYARAAAMAQAQQQQQQLYIQLYQRQQQQQQQQQQAAAGYSPAPTAAAAAAAAYAAMGRGM